MAVFSIYNPGQSVQNIRTFHRGDHFLIGEFGFLPYSFRIPWTVVTYFSTLPRLFRGATGKQRKKSFFKGTHWQLWIFQTIPRVWKFKVCMHIVCIFMFELYSNLCPGEVKVCHGRNLKMQRDTVETRPFRFDVLFWTGRFEQQREDTTNLSTLWSWRNDLEPGMMFFSPINMRSYLEPQNPPKSRSYGGSKVSNWSS